MVRQLINDNGNPAANQFIIKTKEATYFQSYDSVVCKLDGDTTNSIGSYVEVGLIDELCEEHGGVDLAQTLQEEFNKK